MTVQNELPGMEPAAPYAPRNFAVRATIAPTTKTRWWNKLAPTSSWGRKKIKTFFSSAKIWGGKLGRKIKNFLPILKAWGIFIFRKVVTFWQWVKNINFQKIHLPKNSSWNTATSLAIPNFFNGIFGGILLFASNASQPGFFDLILAGGFFFFVWLMSRHLPHEAPIRKFFALAGFLLGIIIGRWIIGSF